MILRLYDLDEGPESTLAYIELPTDQTDRLAKALDGLDIVFEEIQVQCFTRAEDVPAFYMNIQPDPAADIDTESLCSVCREPQFRTTSGLTCRNGHGGAPGVSK